MPLRRREPIRTAVSLGLLIAVFLGGAAVTRTAAGQDVPVRSDGEIAPPRILCVQAHPDDEVMYAATLYGIAQHLDGAIDIAVITDGSGGFDYAMLAEPIYDKALAAEPEARANLPAVRKQEMLRGGEIIGLRNVFFFDEYDHMYLLDADTVLQHVWDADDVRERLLEILSEGAYDAVFTLLPTEDTHGHHKSAAILALEAVQALPAAERPAVLGALATDAEEAPRYGGLSNYPLTESRSTAPDFAFDRRDPLEVDSLLTYQIIVNWLIAEHKSQGTLQLLTNEWDIEHFWLYTMNADPAAERARSLFERLSAWKP